MTELNDGRMMTTSGLNDSDGLNNNTSEIWDGQHWSTEIPGNPGIPDFPAFQFPLYPRMHLLPTGHVFYSAPSSATVDFDPTTRPGLLLHGRFIRGRTIQKASEPTARLSYFRSPQNHYSPKVMIMGGDNPATDTTELIDLSQAGSQISAACPNFAPCWVPGPKMAQTRVEMEATILPNGKVLVDGGSAKDEDATTASLKAEIYDPVSNSFSSAGSNALPRLYHNTQLLLPDGTVALAGGNPEQGVFENHIEIYQPCISSTPTVAPQPGQSSLRVRLLRSLTVNLFCPDSRCSQHRTCSSDESGIGDTLVRYGSTVCRFDICNGTGRSDGHRAARFQHRLPDTTCSSW